MASQHDRLSAAPPHDMTVSDGLDVLWRGAVVIAAVVAAAWLVGVAR